MASSSKRTRLTEREQQQLIDNFLEDIDGYENIDNISDGEQDEDVDEIIEDAIENAGGAGEIEATEDTEGEEPRKQKFRDLSEVLDESNYDHLPPKEKRTYTYATKEMEKNGKSIKWTTHKNMESEEDDSEEDEIEVDEEVDDEDGDGGEEPVAIPVPRRPPGKRRASNIVHDNPGPCADAKNLDKPIQFWSLFFTDEILQVILDFTNSSIERWTAVNQARLTHRDTYVKQLDLIELKAFIGLMYLRGASKKNLLSIVDVFTHKSSPDVFQATTSYRRFQFLCHFDDTLTRGERWKVDKYLNISTFEMR